VGGVVRIVTVARKPIGEGGVAANAREWACGALNVDACRTEYADDQDRQANKSRAGHEGSGGNAGDPDFPHYRRWGTWEGGRGRWPTNVVAIDVDAPRFFRKISGG